jgi:ParB family chromosome partitioning protein
LKVIAHIDREIAARPQLIQIETAWRNPKEAALRQHESRHLRFR